jgi:Ca2+-binding EF-hand superfamily protein
MNKLIVVLAGLCLCTLANAETPANVAKINATPASFAGLDKNADNQISKTEAGVDRKLSDVFAYVDTNGDGFISRSEYLAQTGDTPDAS